VTAGDTPGRTVPDSRPPSKRPLSEAEITQLNEEARLYPWRLFGFTKLAGMIGVSDHCITAVANHKKFRHKALKKLRPEWVLAFLAEPPDDFKVG